MRMWSCQFRSLLIIASLRKPSPLSETITRNGSPGVGSMKSSSAKSLAQRMTSNGLSSFSRMSHSTMRRIDNCVSKLLGGGPGIPRAALALFEAVGSLSDQGPDHDAQETVETRSAISSSPKVDIAMR